VTWRGGVTTSVGGEVALGGEMEEKTIFGLTRILLDQKIKKIHAIDSGGINGQ
jgi:hypothetical protein